MVLPDCPCYRMEEAIAIAQRFNWPPPKLIQHSLLKISKVSKAQA